MKLFTVDKEKNTIRYGMLTLSVRTKDNNRLENIKEKLNNIIANFLSESKQDTTETYAVDINARYSQLSRQSSNKQGSLSANYADICLINERENIVLDNSSVMVSFNNAEELSIFIRVFDSMIRR